MLESSDSVQRNEGGQGDQGRQPDSRRKCVAGTVAHQSILIAFHLSLSQDWRYAFYASVLVETGLAQLMTYGQWSMCADCVCSTASGCVFVMAMVRFGVKRAIGHVS